MLFMPILHVLIGLAAVIVGLGVGTRIAIRRARSLPAPEPTLALAAPAPERPAPPPPPPPKPDPLESAGILRVRHEDRMGSWTFVVKDGQEYNADPKREISPDLLGYVLAENTRDTCTYCKGSKIIIDLVMSTIPPEGAVDLGLAERQRVGVYCERCGAQYHQDSPRVGVKPVPRTGFIGTVIGVKRYGNLLEAIAGEGKAKEIRYGVLKDEYEQLQPRCVRVADSLRHLHAELFPRTDIDPYRGMPLASLDDAPDDRAKAMPALPAEADA